MTSNFTTSLYDEKTFFKAFLRDLDNTPMLLRDNIPNEKPSKENTSVSAE